jgi:GSH-dependent disulfide-bond oxidoreductase
MPKTRKPRAGRAKTTKRIAKRAKAGAVMQTKPIELYFWPTPNGYKISIMLEECGLPYQMIPVNIARGDQFKPEFLAISPNNRMPAIVDPQGPGGKPISIFESGAILQYLGRKTGRFYPAEERKRVEVEEWLFWQMANLGPMAGQTNHFRRYAPEKIEYAVNRYTNEVRRLYGVMNKRLAERDYLAGEYSIADIACVGWSRGWERQGQDISEFPHFRRWLERVMGRSAVQRGFALRVEEAGKIDFSKDKEAWKILFTQGARV